MNWVVHKLVMDRWTGRWGGRSRAEGETDGHIKREKYTETVRPMKEETGGGGRDGRQESRQWMTIQMSVCKSVWAGKGQTRTVG